MQRIIVIDSHTAGEPTRVVVSGGPPLGTGTVAEQLEIFRKDFDTFRSAIVNEPRGSDVLVGALICTPSDKSCVCGVIFFNNVGMLGMCGHGTIGLVVTLAHIGRIAPGTYRIETSVGIVEATLHEDGQVSVTNVPSYRTEKAVKVQVDGHGIVTGDVAWAGNWFFLVEDHGRALNLADVESLTDLSWRIRTAINANGFPLIDHIELFGPPQLPQGNSPRAHSRSFVLCPGKAYDRSPCGTGTSAKLACLAADGKVKPGQLWQQESIVSTTLTGSFVWHDQSKGSILPTIQGRAFVNAEATLLLNENDPFCWGIRTEQSGN